MNPQLDPSTCDSWPKDWSWGLKVCSLSKVVEELLSTCEDIDVEAAEELTEAAMTEVRSINQPDMVK